MATFNSDLIAVGQQTQSVPAGAIRSVAGSVTLPANTELSSVTSDVIGLFSMPGVNSYIVDFWLDNPILDSTNTLRWNLSDGTNLIIPTGTFATSNAALRIVGQANGAAAHALIGSGVRYTAVTPIVINVTTGAGATIGASAVVIYFNFNIAIV